MNDILKEIKKHQLNKNENFFDEDLVETVRTILKDVKAKGDVAVREYTKKFDSVDLKAFQISEKEIKRKRSYRIKTPPLELDPFLGPF